MSLSSSSSLSSLSMRVEAWELDRAGCNMPRARRREFGERRRVYLRLRANVLVAGDGDIGRVWALVGGERRWAMPAKE